MEQVVGATEAETTSIEMDYVGCRFAIEAEVLTPLPVMVSTHGDETLVTAARAKFHWGGHTTDGMVEFMEQLP